MCHVTDTLSCPYECKTCVHTESTCAFPMFSCVLEYQHRVTIGIYVTTDASNRRGRLWHEHQQECPIFAWQCTCRYKHSQPCQVGCVCACVLCEDAHCVFLFLFATYLHDCIFRYTQADPAAMQSGVQWLGPSPAADASSYGQVSGMSLSEK